MGKFHPIFAPTKGRQPYEFENASSLVAALKQAFDPSTYLLIGSLLQCVLFSLLPLRYAVGPPLGLAAILLLDTVLQTKNVIPNRYMKRVIPGRTVAHLPSFASGKFGDRPASEKVVVFLLGARSNHPLGIFAPNFKELGDYFTVMYKNAMDNPNKYGLLGASHWNSAQGYENLGLMEGKVHQSMTLFYFRSVEGLNEFAHSETHIEGVRWWSRITKDAANSHIGIMHETYEVPAGNWETIYENFQPTCMGAVSVDVRDDEKQEEEWVRPLYAMGRGQFRTQYGRMGRTDGTDNEKYARDGFY